METYTIEVDAQGPSGFGSGGFHTRYTDASGDVYYLYIYSSSRETHTLRYNSNNPDIVLVEWSNDGW